MKKKNKKKTYKCQRQTSGFKWGARQGDTEEMSSGMEVMSSEGFQREDEKILLYSYILCSLYIILVRENWRRLAVSALRIANVLRQTADNFLNCTKEKWSVTHTRSLWGVSLNINIWAKPCFLANSYMTGHRPLKNKLFFFFLMVQLHDLNGGIQHKWSDGWWEMAQKVERKKTEHWTVCNGHLFVI